MSTTALPTTVPTNKPSIEPSNDPTDKPTNQPTIMPSEESDDDIAIECCYANDRASRWIQNCNQLSNTDMNTCQTTYRIGRCHWVQDSPNMCAIDIDTGSDTTDDTSDQNCCATTSTSIRRIQRCQQISTQTDCLSSRTCYWQC